MRTKLVATVLAGVSIGVAAGVGLLYVNPLTGAPAPEAGHFDRVLRYDFPSDGALMLTHAGTAPLPMLPAGVPELWESAIRSTASGLVAVAEGDGEPPAVASKITVPSRRTDLLASGVVLDDNWLVTLPGEGSLFVLGDSNVWPAVKENLVSVRVFGRSWAGPRSYRTTEGPGVRGTALVVGATGRFKSVQGSAMERFQLTEFNRSSGFESFTGELHLRLVDAQQVVEPE
jgi:hypothetical protein